MKTHILILGLVIMTMSSARAATTCSRANLTRCLDSACAIGISSNASARCQYCGTTAAGTPPKNAMKTVSVGSPSKYNISDKELAKAPNDPGQRYAWATAQCIKRVAGCTTDNVNETYDSLIEQSCRAAGISIKMAQTIETADKKKSKTACQSEITKCVISDKNCTANYRNCSDNSSFSKIFSTCAVSVTGCDEYLSAIRTDLASARDTAIKGANTILAQIVATYKSARDKKLNSVKSGCKDNSARESCIATVCANNMPNHCAAGHESEKSMATQLCKFYDIACATID